MSHEQVLLLAEDSRPEAASPGVHSICLTSVTRCCIKRSTRRLYGNVFMRLADALFPRIKQRFPGVLFSQPDRAGHRKNLFASLEHAVPATEKGKPIFEKAHRDRYSAEYHGMTVIYSGSETEAFSNAIKNLQEEVELMFRDRKKQHTPSMKR